MIGKLTGIIDTLTTNGLILDVHGVGYVVATSGRTLNKIGSVGSAVSLLIETQVREDAINLFGFADKLERDWFRLLTTVQGVGAKVALAILGSLPPDQLAHAIAAQDKTTITRADGVGPKLALRLLTELKDKVVGDFAPTTLSTTNATLQTPPGAATEALSALTNLGYKRVEAFAAVTAAVQKAAVNAPLQDLIRLSLAELSRKDNV